jgi:hypothetical protein
MIAGGEKFELGISKLRPNPLLETVLTELVLVFSSESSSYSKEE